MPPLRNIKHEEFARQLIAGMKSGRTRGQSYTASGYKAEGESAEVNASRLLRNARNGVVDRVRELAGGGARRAEITVQGLLEKLDIVFDGATAAKQYSAAGRAAEAQAKIAGVGAADRVEIGGPGTFAAPSSVEQVVDNLIADLGDPASALIEAEQLYNEIRANLEARAAAVATVVVDAPSPTSEAALALELLRPARKGRRERAD